MIYVMIGLMAVFVLYKAITFIINRKKVKSIDSIDKALVKSVNEQKG